MNTCCNLNDVNDSVAIRGVNDRERLFMYPSQACRFILSFDINTPWNARNSWTNSLPVILVLYSIS